MEKWPVYGPLLVLRNSTGKCEKRLESERKAKKEQIFQQQ